VWNT